MKTITGLGIAMFALMVLLLAFAIYKPAVTGYLSASGTQLLVSGGTYGHGCNFTMQPGWNLISIICVVDNTTLQYVLESIEGDYESVHDYEPLDLNDQWKSYNPGLPMWVGQDLTNITPEKGYWIQINNTANYYIEGLVTIPGVIPLEPGWQLVGYPIWAAKSSSYAFRDLTGNITSAHAYNASDNSDHWKVYVPGVNSSFNDLAITMPYWGYWINATTPSVWVMSPW